MALLATWTRGDHTADSLDGETLSFPTYRKGAGPGVIVIPDTPGLIPEVIEFAEEGRRGRLHGRHATALR